MQPITTNEIEKVSPLACSMVKPPDPDMMTGLSLREQREVMAHYAQQKIASGPRTDLKFGVRRSSDDEAVQKSASMGKSCSFICQEELCLP